MDKLDRTMSSQPSKEEIFNALNDLSWFNKLFALRVLIQIREKDASKAKKLRLWYKENIVPAIETT